MTAPDGKLKVFISWSGELAKQVTLVLRDWLPQMFDKIAPWMSDVDIEAGSRGLDDIAAELNETSFGIIVVTRTNQDAPWLNFEAGALSKRFPDAKTRVAPLLVDMTNTAQITGPIKQFQCSVLDRSGIEKLLKGIAKVTDTEWANVEQRLEWSWPSIEAKLTAIKAGILPAGQGPPTRTAESMLEELLNLVRPLPDTLKTSLSSSRVQSDMDRLVARYARESEDELARKSPDDTTYIQNWKGTKEYALAISRAKAKFNESWEFYENVRLLTSLPAVLVALSSGSLHPRDIGELASLYNMADRPVDDLTSLRHIVLRHAEVMRVITKAGGLAGEDSLSPEEKLDRLAEIDDPENLRRGFEPA